MRNFIRHFERERDGVWRCKTFATLLLPEGKKIEIAPPTVLVRGSSFMGLDLAQMLEEQLLLDNAPLTVRRPPPPPWPGP